MMGWYGPGMGTFELLAMGLFWLVLLGLIAWLVVRVLPASSGRPSEALSWPPSATGSDGPCGVPLVARCRQQ